MRNSSASSGVRGMAGSSGSSSLGSSTTSGSGSGSGSGSTTGSTTIGFGGSTIFVAFGVEAVAAPAF